MIKARSRRPISGQTTSMTPCEPTVHLYNIPSNLRKSILELIFQIWKLYVSVNSLSYLPRSRMVNAVLVCWSTICAFQVEGPSRDVNGSIRSQAPPVPAPPIPDRASRTSTASSFDHNVSALSSSYATKLSFHSPVTAYERALQKVTLRCRDLYIHVMYMNVYNRYIIQNSIIKLCAGPEKSTVYSSSFSAGGRRRTAANQSHCIHTIETVKTDSSLETLNELFEITTSIQIENLLEIMLKTFTMT